MRYAIVRADGTHEVVESGDTPVNYKLFQKLVAAPSEEGKGFYQAIGGNLVSIYLNENGKYLSEELEVNVAVTRYARDNALIWPNDYIMGDCVIMGLPDEEGEETEFDENTLNDIISYL